MGGATAGKGVKGPRTGGTKKLVQISLRANWGKPLRALGSIERLPAEIKAVE